MKENENIDWDRFCADSGWFRDRIDRPWVKDGYKYATNGRVIIRAVCSEPDILQDYFPDATKLPWNRKGPLVPWIKPLETEKMCSHCEGEGWLEDTQLRTVCRICKGKGSVYYPTRVTINGRIFNQPYVVLVASLPDVYYVDTEPSFENEPLKFVFVRGEGLIMPYIVPKGAK